MQCCKAIVNKVASIKDVFNAPNTFQLSDLNRVNNALMKSVIIKHIEGMLMYFGYKKDDMTAGQVNTVADDIIEKYYYLNIHDLCLVFKKARQNKNYGGFYGRIDASVIMSWFATYDRERDDVIHSLPNGQKPFEPTGEECTREEYYDMLLAKVAGGDMYAGADLARFTSLENTFNLQQVEYGNYKYWMKHRFDKREEQEQWKSRKR